MPANRDAMRLVECELGDILAEGGYEGAGRSPGLSLLRAAARSVGDRLWQENSDLGGHWTYRDRGGIGGHAPPMASLPKHCWEWRERLRMLTRLEVPAELHRNAPRVVAAGYEHTGEVLINLAASFRAFRA